MNKQSKIQQIRELINAPEPPKIPKGIYRSTNIPGIYNHENGFEISFTGLKEVSKAANLMVEAVTIAGFENPLIIKVSPFTVGWVENRTIETPSVEVMQNHWRNCGLSEIEIEKRSKELTSPEKLIENFIQLWENE